MTLKEMIEEARQMAETPERGAGGGSRDDLLSSQDEEGTSSRRTSTHGMLWLNVVVYLYMH